MATRSRRRAGFIAAAAAVLATLAPPGPSPARALGFSAQAAPAGWPHRELGNGTAVLSYPPALRPIPGDTGTVTVAMRSPAGAYLLYLNATPRQGAETLRNWAQRDPARRLPRPAGTAAPPLRASRIEQPAHG